MIIVIYDAHILSFAGSQNYCKDACKSIHKPAIINPRSSVGLERQTSNLLRSKVQVFPGMPRVRRGTKIAHAQKPSGIILVRMR